MDYRTSDPYVVRTAVALEQLVALGERLLDHLTGTTTVPMQSEDPTAGDGTSKEQKRIMATSFVEVQVRLGPKSWEEIATEGARFDFPERALRDVRDAVAVPKKESDGKWRWHPKATRPKAPAPE